MILGNRELTHKNTVFHQIDTIKPDEQVGRKFDTEKLPLFKGAVGHFPNAMEGVAAASAFGANKYAWDNWRFVDNGVERYTDALVRHLIAEAKGEVLDIDSGLPHAWHVAWCALARIELMLQKDKDNNDE